jgi:putative endonuclease
MHYCYILFSESLDRYYIGSCSDLKARILRHNAGAIVSTKSGRPWKLVYNEEFKDGSSAIKRENEIKRMKSRKYILRLIEKVRKN